jgi:polar amino acid transport system substrate-binding protein
LLNAEREFGIHAVSYDDDVHPYSDLVIGRIDAVLLDNVLAERRTRNLSGLAIQPQSVAMGHYVGILAARNSALRDQIDDILRTAMRDGTLERISANGVFGMMISRAFTPDCSRRNPWPRNRL